MNTRTVDTADAPLQAPTMVVPPSPADPAPGFVHDAHEREWHKWRERRIRRTNP